MASNTGEKCKTISRSLLKSGRALVRFLGNQWQPMIQGLTCLCVCVSVCVYRPCTRPALKDLCRISRDTKGMDPWVIDMNNYFFLAFPLSFFLSLRFQMRLLDVRLCFGGQGRRICQLGLCLPAGVTGCPGSDYWLLLPGPPGGQWVAPWAVMWPLRGCLQCCPLRAATVSSPGGKNTRALWSLFMGH